MPSRACISLALLQTAFSARPMEVWLDARPLGPAHGAASLLDASDGLFDRAIVAGAADDERFFVADASEPVARLRFSDESIAGGSTIVTGDASQSAAIALVGSVAWCHVDATAGQPCIVAENLLAKADGTGTRIACTCREAADVQGLAFALDKGVDAPVISDADDLREAAASAEQPVRHTAGQLCARVVEGLMPNNETFSSTQGHVRGQLHSHLSNSPWGHCVSNGGGLWALGAGRLCRPGGRRPRLVAQSLEKLL